MGPDLPVAWSPTGQLTVVDGKHADWRHAFYGATIQSLQRAGAETRRLSLLEAAAVALPCPDPSLVILHSGRSGSTLLARALEVAGPLAIAREPDPVHDALISAAMDPSVPSRLALLLQVRIATGLLSTAARNRGRELGLKLPTVATMAVAETINTFPSSPLIFLVRNPVDSARSIARQPPLWISESTIDDLLDDAEPSAADSMDIDRTGDRIAIRYTQLWRRLVDHVLAIEDRHVHVVLYEDLLDDLAAATGAVLRHTGRDGVLGPEAASALADLEKHEAKGLGDKSFVRNSTSPLSIELEAELRVSLAGRMTLLRDAAQRSR